MFARADEGACGRRARRRRPRACRSRCRPRRGDVACHAPCAPAPGGDHVSRRRPTAPSRTTAPVPSPSRRREMEPGAGRRSARAGFRLRRLAMRGGRPPGQPSSNTASSRRGGDRHDPPAPRELSSCIAPDGGRGEESAASSAAVTPGGRRAPDRRRRRTTRPACAGLDRGRSAPRHRLTAPARVRATLAVTRRAAAVVHSGAPAPEKTAARLPRAGGLGERRSTIAFESLQPPPAIRQPSRYDARERPPRSASGRRRRAR